MILLIIRAVSGEKIWTKTRLRLVTGPERNVRKNKRYTRTRVRSSTIGKSVTSPQLVHFFYSFIPRTPTHPSWKIHSTFPAFLSDRVEGAIAIPPSSTRHAIVVLLFRLWCFIPRYIRLSIRISIRQWIPLQKEKKKKIGIFCPLIKMKN